METRKRHAALFDALTRLTHVPDAHVAKGLLELTEAIEFEFRLADERMEAAGCPGLHAQREWRARMLGALHRAAPSATSGNMRDIRHMVAMLPYWLYDHFSTIEAVLPANHPACPATVWH
ncbi:hypothetical protein [Massilia sp. BJB1822]|uniref:hypothetical protein n=1 Tax=Massilia sp. BJB1822 TaxID=2744470 RepID=UPI001593DDAC|nr:hypothetical protein [Massilia sp. BJB1822]NVD97770.1 hypothetical protein [Massilia sp. BJB1822]